MISFLKWHMRVHIVALYNVPSRWKRQDVCSVVKRASENSSTEDSLANIHTYCLP